MGQFSHLALEYILSSYRFTQVTCSMSIVFQIHESGIDPDTRFVLSSQLKPQRLVISHSSHLELVKDVDKSKVPIWSRLKQIGKGVQSVFGTC